MEKDLNNNQFLSVNNNSIIKNMHFPFNFFFHKNDQKKNFDFFFNNYFGIATLSHSRLRKCSKKNNEIIKIRLFFSQKSQNFDFF